MRFEIKFNDKDPLSVFLKPLTSFTEFQNTIIRKLGLQGIKRVDKLFYRISIFVVRDDVKYDSFAIGSYEDLQVLFHYCWQFPEVRTPKLLAKLVDVVSSSGGSNHNPQPSATAACSSSRLVGASSSLPMIEPEVALVAFPSFAANLNRAYDREVGIPDVVPESRQGRAPDSVKDVF
ncbi:hypothetical protein Ahy_B09g098008 isoform B [Arachis hypogaea]|uniref:Uncharacterized protein n=1 Tax=Arachis hypogaea TaxID=3818 RepID=A0A444XQI1_ARAHY|nr:hypothetical protein Ahy_B09g098008 isoform B [Arachis hypogaea]